MCCIHMFSGLRPDVERGLMDICMLCISVIIACVCVCVDICYYMLGEAHFTKLSSMTGWGSMTGETHYMFIVCMVYGIWRTH